MRCVRTEWSHSSTETAKHQLNQNKNSLSLGAAFGFLHLPSIVCVSFYFDTKRALATGITSCGTPIGAIIFAPLTEILLNVSSRLHLQNITW